MAVNLKSIPQQSNHISPPKWWIWLILLVVAIGIGFAIAVTNNETENTIQGFWGTFLGIPLLSWLILLILRFAYYKGEVVMIDGWGKERHKHIEAEIKRGRQFLSILDMNLYTGHRKLDDLDGSEQWLAIQSKEFSIKTQVGWDIDAEPVRHSKLNIEKDETLDQVTIKYLHQIIENLSQTLALIPADTSISILIEVNESLSFNDIKNELLTALGLNVITQPVNFIDNSSSGLFVIDDFLDNRINENDLLFVVAMEMNPTPLRGSAESIVSLLLGQIKDNLEMEVIANLHRPEQVTYLTTKDFSYGLERALDWVPIDVEKLPKAWFANITNEQNLVITSELTDLSSPINIGEDIHDLNLTLGSLGVATPWTSIVCAASEIVSEKQPQLLFTGINKHQQPLWITIVMPFLVN